jgi:hypothetical protein
VSLNTYSKSDPAVHQKFAAEYKKQLVAALASLFPSPHGLFHVTAELPPGATRAALDRAIRTWLARVDRHYLGRNWASPHLKSLRTDGVIFYEANGGNLHAHMVIKPSGKKGSAFRFSMEAKYLYQRHPSKFWRRFRKQPVADRGIMHVQAIGSSLADLNRVLGYDAKQLEWSNKSILEWNFISHLASTASSCR